MVDCKCFKNLAGFAVSRPPCVVFTVCLAAFAIGLFSLGYFVQVFGWFEENDASTEDWNMFLRLLGLTEFCLFGNQSFYENNTNSTNITGPTPVGFTHVSIPVTLRLQPSEHFDSVFENVTHVTSEVSASDFGLHGFHGNVLINITLSLPRPWTINCRGKKCTAVTFDTCGVVSLPAGIVPDHLSSGSCNVSSVVSKVAQMSIWNSACSDGIEAQAIATVHKQFTTAKALTMYDAVNLRLQYSSYFLFVLVISCVLYGMIKGKPAKQNFKKSNLPI